MEIIAKLGNPNKEYYNGNKQFLNYFELGLDIMLDHSDHTVSKIILHTNNT